ncbi:hypothetical protein ACP4OV_009465 [Aristida adscensionis]
MGKGWDAFFNWSHANDPDKCFFKIMIGEFRERMVIPDKFAQHFRGKLTKKITLEAHAGCTFDVQITKNQDEDLALQSGWKAFADAHDLKIGDFLVFKYCGISKMKVLIFDPSGCEKVSSCRAMRNAAHGGGRREQVIDPSSSSHDLPTKSPQRGTKATSTAKLSGNVSSSECGPKAHSVPSYILKFGTRLTAAQNKAMEAKIRSNRSKIPLYGCIIKKYSVYGKRAALDFSKRYADVYLLPIGVKTLMLRCHGKIWEVHSYRRKDGITRTLGGWKQFVHDNNLQVGDFCLFELLKVRKYTMNVHIIRKK